MRIVIDTGVLVSAAIKAQSTPSLAVHRAIQVGILLKSPATEAELIAVIGRPYLAKLIAPAARDHLMEVMAAASPVEITTHIAACRDPKDDKFLELAVHGRADFVVTGDNDLLVLHPFRGVPIVTPGSFLQHTG